MIERIFFLCCDRWGLQSGIRYFHRTIDCYQLHSDGNRRKFIQLDSHADTTGHKHGTNTRSSTYKSAATYLMATGISGAVAYYAYTNCKHPTKTNTL